ncbi:C4-dicarboxylate/malic acid transporter [Aspergillus luchuensis]|uniref:C4-dicarboxylate/malic acid transporter n=1 Tax=Aspergillus kawachii TaxID=1069201 RepID=A0A146FBS6_ASPKA|nr:C4-dicarboxylate/malic acid transporter [Aspergillus luchuensis]
MVVLSFAKAVPRLSFKRVKFIGLDGALGCRGVVQVGHAVWVIVDIIGSQKSVNSMALRPE